MKRTPPTNPRRDDLANQCGVVTVSFGVRIPSYARCHYCGGKPRSRDHIVPDSVGGSKAWWNLVPSCHDCNTTKADRQSCSCLYCLRAMALWQLGYRRTGQSWTEKKNGKEERRKARAQGQTPVGEGLH